MTRNRGLELLVLAISLFVVAIALTFLVHRMVLHLQKRINEDKGQSDGRIADAESFFLDGFLPILLVFATLIPLGLVILKILRYSLSFFIRIRNQMVRNPMGAGIFCGFMTIITLGYLSYFILVPRLFFDNFEDSFFFEHQQKRVAAMTSFLTGQFLKVLSFYNPTVHMRLVQTDSIFLLFLGFFIFQVLWTYFTIMRNWRFLYPNDKRKRVVRRVIFVQLEFILNFLVQLLPSDSHIEKLNSMVSVLINTYLFKDSRNKVVFIWSSFVGWLIGHILSLILYTKLFGFLVAWARVYMNYLKRSKGKRKGKDDKDDKDNNNNPFFRFDK